MEKGNGVKVMKRNIGGAFKAFMWGRTDYIYYERNKVILIFRGVVQSFQKYVNVAASHGITQNSA